jgi:hypothetical protein
LLIIGVVLALVPVGALATHGQPEKFPAYYDGRIVTVMMGPSGNSSNPNQAPSPCFGVGPDFSQTARAADVPLFYALFVPGASQMYCPDGTFRHDMVLSAIPGDPSYNAAVQVVRCVAGPNFATANMPYTSAAAVEAGIARGELQCVLGAVLLSPVVGGP